jgi:hypothetical protein
MKERNLKCKFSEALFVWASWSRRFEASQWLQPQTEAVQATSCWNAFSYNKGVTILQSAGNLSLSEVAARPSLQASSVRSCKNFKYRKKELSQMNTLFK